MTIETNTERDRHIREAHDLGKSTRELALAYGISRGRVSQIVNEERPAPPWTAEDTERALKAAREAGE